jgi:hypothetical protein
VQPALAKAREVQGGLAQRLRGQRAGVHHRAAVHRLLLDERDRLAEVRGLHRALLSCGPTTDDDQIEFVHEARERSVARGQRPMAVTCSINWSSIRQVAPQTTWRPSPQTYTVRSAR